MTRFEAMVRGLQAHPDVLVKVWSKGAPCTEAELVQAEADLGRPLDPALRSVYREANGLSLLWYRLDTDPEGPGTTWRSVIWGNYGTDTWEEARDRYYADGSVARSTISSDDRGWYPGGIVQLPTLREVVEGTAEWQGIAAAHAAVSQGEVTFVGHTLEHAHLYRRLRLFDHYADDSAAMLLLEPGGDTVVVRLYQWIPGKTVTCRASVGSYLEYLLYSRGAPALRGRFFSAGGPDPQEALPQGLAEVSVTDSVATVEFAPRSPKPLE